MKREEAIKILKDLADVDNSTPIPNKLFYEAFDMAIEALQDKSTGKWIKAKGIMPPEFHGHHYCSKCGNFANMEPPFGNREDLSEFCPNCGVYMKVEGNE